MNALTVFGRDENHLVEWTDSRSPGKNWRLHKNVMADWQLMVDAATDDGIALALLSSYRSFDRQLLIWNEKFNGQRRVHDEHNITLHRNQFDDWSWCQKILRYSALPGLSRHHWGSDLDVFDGNALNNGVQPQLDATEFCDNGPCAALNDWLTARCHQFGFYRPYVSVENGVAPEPWHLSHVATANTLMPMINVAQLHDILMSSDIAGKSVVLAHLDWIVQQYALHIDKPTR